MTINEHEDKISNTEEYLKGVQEKHNSVLDKTLREIKDILAKIKNKKNDPINASRIEEKRTGESFAAGGMTLFFLCFAAAAFANEKVPTLDFFEAIRLLWLPLGASLLLMLDGILRVKASYTWKETGVVKKTANFIEIYSIKNLKELYEKNKYLFFVLIIESLLVCLLLYLPIYITEVRRLQIQYIMDYIIKLPPGVHWEYLRIIN